MIFYKEDLSNLVNVFAQNILFPLNSFSVFFLFFGMRSKIITVVRLIPNLMSTFIFLVTSDKDLSAKNLNDNLSRTNHCGFQWKKKFNPDLSKEIQEIIFSSQNSKISEPSIIKIQRLSQVFSSLQEFFFILSQISRNI